MDTHVVGSSGAGSMPLDGVLDTGPQAGALPSAMPQTVRVAAQPISPLASLIVLASLALIGAAAIAGLAAT